MDKVERPVLCPKCNGEYLHPLSVTIDPAGYTGKAVEISCKGVQEKKSDNERRGVEIITTFWCEEDHGFMRIETFHKGQTLVVYVMIEGFAPEEIWRD